MLSIQLLDLFDIVIASEKDGGPLVKLRRHKVEHPALASEGLAARLLHDERHGEALVQNAQLAVGALLVGRVQEDATVQESTVHVSDHAAK